MDMMWYRRRGLLLSTPHIVNESGSIVTFDSAYNKIPIKSLICNIEPIQEGSGNPSPENVRPISGRAGLSVVRCGKNLIPTIYDGNVTKNGITFEVKPDGVHATGTATSSTYYDVILRDNQYNQVPILPAGTYTLSPTGVQQNDVDIRVAEIADQAIIAAANTSKTTFTITGSKQYFCFFYIPSGTIFNDAVLTPQIEVGPAATDYEAYKGSTYSVNWESEAGTVYGGTMDVVSGKLVVDRAMVDLGTLSWNYEASIPRFYTSGINSVVKKVDNVSVANCVSSMFKVTSFNDLYIYSKQNGTMSVNDVGTLSIIDNAYSDTESFRTAMSGVQLCYELAAPTEIQLTPQEVRTLLGTNNIWCDSGNVSVNYWKWGK